jgi:hypothetical protein
MTRAVIERSGWIDISVNIAGIFPGLRFKVYEQVGIEANIGYR